MYIDPNPPDEAFWARDFDTGKILKYPVGHSKAEEPLFLRKFIPARLTDNPYLFDDGQYEAMLMSLPEIERKRLLDGDWDVADGSAFTEFSRSTHVVEPFDVRMAGQGYDLEIMGILHLLVYFGELSIGIITSGSIENYM